MAAPYPSLVVQYNNIPAICMDCYYTYNPTSSITISSIAFKGDKSGLTISLSSADSSLFTQNTLNDITVTLYGQPCKVDAGGTSSSFQCTFNTVTCNGATLPHIPAGNESP